MKKINILFWILVVTVIKLHAQAQTDFVWPASNPPFKEHHFNGLWTESFVLDSVTIIKDTTKRSLIKAPNDLGTIDKAIASYVSFNTKAWGKSLYKLDFYKDIDYPTDDIVNEMNSEDHKLNGYYKHYLTLNLMYDTTEVAACFVETYYSQKEPKVHYLLMFERKSNGWYLLGGNPYQYLKSLSEIKYHYVMNLLQGLKMKVEEPNAKAYNELLSKVYKNNILNLNVLMTEMIPNVFDKDSIKNYKAKYSKLLATPNYIIDWSLISQNKIVVNAFESYKTIFLTYFEKDVYDSR